MKGVSYITDDRKRVKAVVIDLKTIKEREEEVYDLIDVLVAESRKGEPTSSWEDVKKSLKSKGKL